MRIAFVYDRVNKWGGAEHVLLALHEIWPEAPLFTAVYDKKRTPWANVFDIRPSFLQNIPFAVRHHEFFAWLTPLAFESVTFDEYDVVLSVTSAEVKGIITKPHTCHICYCLTPTRYLWSGYDSYVQYPGFGTLDGIARSIFPHVAPTLRRWDQIAAQRPDYYIAISKHVADRIKKYYGRDVENIIYPPVDVEKFTRHSSLPPLPSSPGHVAVRTGLQRAGIIGQKDYFLVISRLVGYKRVDLAIAACNKLNVPLVVIGDGMDRRRLLRLAGPTVRFVAGHLTDAELAVYYGRCRALLVAGEEDFGIVAVEALAAGRPVIAYRESGVAEVVTEGKTGILVGSQTIDDFAYALRRVEALRVNQAACQKTALRFGKERFQGEFKKFVESLYQRYCDRLSL